MTLPVRWCFLLFVASNQLDYAFRTSSDMFAISKGAGILLAAATLLQPTVCFAKPPKAFWFFLIYSCVYFLRGLVQPVLGENTVMTTLTQLQCLLLLWISYNVFRYGGVQNWVFVSLLLSNSVVAVSSSLGVGSSMAEGRETAFGRNQNELAFLYAIGLLSGVALLTNKKLHSYWRLLTVPFILLLLAKVVATGSRSGLLCFAIGVVTYGMSVRGIGGRLKGVAVVGIIAVLLGYMVLRSDVTRERLEKTFSTGSVAGRDKIALVTFKMFLEKPIFGWGPTTHLEEVARREWNSYQRTQMLDTHNDLMFSLTATGLAGTAFLFWGFWLCIWEGWKGRKGRAGPFPLAFMMGAMLMSMSGTMQRRKPIWIISAMALASGAAVSAARAPRMAVRRAFIPGPKRRPFTP
ncbi:MAG: O-antigen ligase family protein [Planctomycetaceae bacterium]|nr:O-antigen ligase family protein [Planctomycetaceae bacterium]